MTAPRRIRVLFLGKDASRGGTMRELAYLLKYLDKLHFEALVLLTRGGDLLEEYKKYATVEVFEELLPKRNRRRKLPGNIRLPGLVAEFLDLRETRQANKAQNNRLNELLGSFQPDVVVWHYHYPIPLFDAIQKLGVGGIQHVQQRYAQLATMSEQDVSRLFTRARFYVCEGSGVRDEIHMLGGIPYEKIRIIPMPLDKKVIAKHLDETVTVRRADLGIPESTILVGTVASYHFAKGADLLLAAAKHIRACSPERDIRFMWVGGRPFMFKSVLGASLTALASEYGVSDMIHFVGDQQDVYPYLELLDIYAHPARFDAFPHAILEALALKKPAVSFRQGLAEEDFAQEAMLVAENFDPRALAEAIVRLADSPSLRRELGERGANLVLEKFDTNKNIRSYETLLEQAADTPIKNKDEIKYATQLDP